MSEVRDVQEEGWKTRRFQRRVGRAERWNRCGQAQLLQSSTASSAAGRCMCVDEVERRCAVCSRAGRELNQADVLLNRCHRLTLMLMLSLLLLPLLTNMMTFSAHDNWHHSTRSRYLLQHRFLAGISRRYHLMKSSSYRRLSPISSMWVSSTTNYAVDNITGCTEMNLERLPATDKRI